MLQKKEFTSRRETAINNVVGEDRMRRMVGLSIINQTKVYVRGEIDGDNESVLRQVKLSRRPQSPDCKTKPRERAFHIHCRDVY